MDREQAAQAATENVGAPDFESIVTVDTVVGGVPVVEYRYQDPRLAGYRVAVVADTAQETAVCKFGGDNPGRVLTMVGRFPRCVLAEFNTHRVFSRNSASSRARSVKSVLQGVLEDPYVPVFTQNQAGMSGDFITSPQKAQALTGGWFAARDAAVSAFLGVLLGEHYDPALPPMESMEKYYQLYRGGEVTAHKQDVNRVLEPFMWHEVVFTSVFWENFLRLRCDPATTYVPFYAFALLVKRALKGSSPVLSGPHVPFLPKGEREELVGDMAADTPVLLRAAAAAAGVSYRDMTDTAANQALGERLLRAGHLSPFEHIAYPAGGGVSTLGGNLGGEWVQFRRFLEEQDGQY